MSLHHIAPTGINSTSSQRLVYSRDFLLQFRNQVKTDAALREKLHSFVLLSGVDDHVSKTTSSVPRISRTNRHSPKVVNTEPQQSSASSTSRKWQAKKNNNRDVSASEEDQEQQPQQQQQQQSTSFVAVLEQVKEKNESADNKVSTTIESVTIIQQVDSAVVDNTKSRMSTRSQTKTSTPITSSSSSNTGRTPLRPLSEASNSSAKKQQKNNNNTVAQINSAKKSVATTANVQKVAVVSSQQKQLSAMNKENTANSLVQSGVQLSGGSKETFAVNKKKENVKRSLFSEVVTPTKKTLVAPTLSNTSPLASPPSTPSPSKYDNEESPMESPAGRLASREKQIQYGYNTIGYQRYLELVPKTKRTRGMPQTPDKNQKCSKRSWDGQIRKWRRELHNYDPEDVVVNSNENDITNQQSHQQRATISFTTDEENSLLIVDQVQIISDTFSKIPLSAVNVEKESTRQVASDICKSLYF